jgi:tripartite ATP-independent transporter DctM subunit
VDQLHRPASRYQAGAAGDPVRDWAIELIPTPQRRFQAERAAAGLVGLLCAVILISGVCIVAVAVVCRYLLDSPLEASDEMGMAVLIAITFFGSALTLYRSEHLGISAFRNRLPGGWAAAADGFAAWVVLAVSLGLTWASVPLLESIMGQTTVSGLLPASVNYWPVLVGGGAMSVFAAFHLTRIPARALLASGVVVAALLAPLVAWGTLGPASPGAGVWIMLAIDGVCLVLAVPVAFALAAGSLAYIEVTGTLPLVEFAQQMQSGVGNFVLLAIPFFILVGLVMDVNGMSGRLIAFLDMLFGRVRGGLSVVMVAAMAVFSGISGSKSADVAAVGSIMLPAMRQTGYDEDDAVALLAASAVMGETIPPCINMIILGYVANVSIGGLFIAVLSARSGRDLRPAVARRPARAVLRITAGAFAAFLLILIIVGGIVGGIATPTEVSAIAVLYALLVGGLAFREMSWRSFQDFLLRSASLSGMILFIVAAAQMLSYLLTVNLIPQHMAASMAGIGVSYGAWVFLLISIVMLIVMGSVLEGAPALIIFGPLLFPAAHRLSIDPLHFGILLIIAMGIGLFAPPLGVGLYTACAVGGVPIERVARPIAKYLAVLFATLLLIAFVPAVTLALPRWFGLM